MSLDGITYANKSLILKNPALLQKRRREENTTQQYSVDSHLEMLDFVLWLTVCEQMDVKRLDRQ